MSQQAPTQQVATPDVPDDTYEHVQGQAYGKEPVESYERVRAQGFGGDGGPDAPETKEEPDTDEGPAGTDPGSSGDVPAGAQYGGNEPAAK